MPTGIVVVLGHLVEAELLVVVGPHPLGGVNGAPLQSRVDVPARQHLGHHAQAAHHLAAGPGDAHLEALEVGEAPHLLAEPAPHLDPGVAPRELDDVEVGEDGAEKLNPAPVVHPGVLLPGGEAEGHAGVKGQDLGLAHVVVARRVPRLHRALLHRVHNLEAGDDLPRLVDPDLEAAPREGGDPVGQDLRRPVDGVQALGEATGHAPADGGAPLGEDGAKGRARRHADACPLQKVAPLHLYSPPLRVSAGIIPQTPRLGKPLADVKVGLGHVVGPRPRGLHVEAEPRVPVGVAALEADPA